MQRIIGIDFDNTIASYDHLFHREALNMGLISPKDPVNKTSIRDKIRKRHDDIAWQKLQGRVYGPLMQDAEIIYGVMEFLKLCKKRDDKVYIISHKTKFANFDKTCTNLRQASLSWMEQQNFFKPQAIGLTRDDIFFESTRHEKINRITQLGCHIFIDDLVEVLTDENFAPSIIKILFRCTYDNNDLSLITCKNWREITAHVFTSIDNVKKQS